MYIRSDKFLSRQRNDLFLKNRCWKMGFYNNVPRKQQLIYKAESLLPTLKVKLHGRIVMLCVWWDHCGIIHFELLNHRHLMQTYFQPLQHGHENLRKKTPHSSVEETLCFSFNNIIPHSAIITQEKILI